MSKPQWKPQLNEDQKKRGDKFCLNCQWRISVWDRPYCQTCADAFGGVNELPPRGPTQRQKNKAAKEYLAEQGLLAITCKACGSVDHVSKDCPIPKPAYV